MGKKKSKPTSKTAPKAVKKVTKATQRKARSGPALDQIVEQCCMAVVDNKEQAAHMLACLPPDPKVGHRYNPVIQAMVWEPSDFYSFPGNPSEYVRDLLLVRSKPYREAADAEASLNQLKAGVRHMDEDMKAYMRKQLEELIDELPKSKQMGPWGVA